jgi:pyrroloquinoline quinone biosynthesis protein D
MNEDRIPEINSFFRLQWEEAQNSFVLLYPEGMVKLSQSAGEILKRINGKSSVQDIIRDLQSTFPDVDLTSDVITFINQATENGWLNR